MRTQPLPLLALMAFLFTGCGSVLPGHDPIVVNAERQYAFAKASINDFLLWEYNNRATVDKKVTKLADEFRDEAPKWLLAARDATRLYKVTRSEEDRSRMDSALRVLLAAVTKAQEAIK